MKDLKGEAPKLYARIVKFKRERREEYIDMMLSDRYPYGFARDMVKAATTLKPLSDAEADELLRLMAAETGHSYDELAVKLANIYIKERVYDL